MPVANQLVESIGKDYPWLTDRCEYLCGDRSLDDRKIITRVTSTAADLILPLDSSIARYEG